MGGRCLLETNQKTKTKIDLKKLTFILSIIAMTGALTTGAFAVDKKYTEGSCCDKANKKGEKCSKECCVKAEKDDKVCDHCNKKK